MVRKQTLFVVDGDEKRRAEMEELGRSLSLQVEGFDGGQSFLAAYRSGHCGCLISEFRIWDISGLQIQHHLQEIGAWLPVIFVSAYVTVPLALRAIRSGALDVFEKPADETELTEAVQRAVRLCNRRAEQAARRSRLLASIENLTKGEVEVLAALQTGSSPHEMAATLAVSPRTVQLRRKRILQKLGARTLAELLDMCHEIEGAGAGCLWGCEERRFSPCGKLHRASGSDAMEPSGRRMQ